MYFLARERTNEKKREETWTKKKGLKTAREIMPSQNVVKRM